jgi:hypothetical protein
VTSKKPAKECDQDHVTSVNKNFKNYFVYLHSNVHVCRLQFILRNLKLISFCELLKNFPARNFEDLLFSCQNFIEAVKLKGLLQYDKSESVLNNICPFFY